MTYETLDNGSRVYTFGKTKIIITKKQLIADRKLVKLLNTI